MVWEIEEIERILKTGASDIPLTPKEKDALHSQIMRIHNRMNKFIQDEITKRRLANK